MFCISSFPYLWNETFPKGNAQFFAVVLGAAISGAGYVGIIGGVSKVRRKSCNVTDRENKAMICLILKIEKENAFAVSVFSTLVWRKRKSFVYSSNDDVANFWTGDRYWINTIFGPKL